MTKPLVYLASASVLSASRKLRGAGAAGPATGAVIQRRLGRTGVTLPVISMGVMNADIPGLLVRAYELGVRLFDTAAAYQGGRNEEMLGNFVKEHGVRDKVVIATKIGLRGQMRQAEAAEVKAVFTQALEGCLRRLQMEYVDILHFHGVGTATDVNAPAVQEVLADFKKQGKIRFTGVSTHSGQAEVLNAVAQGGFYDVVLVAVNFTMSENKAVLEAIQNAAAKGVGLIAMKTQAGGRASEDALRHTAALKWVLQNEAITTAVPGVTKFEHIDLDFSVASNLAFTPDEQQFLSDKALQASLEFCQQCGECVPSCPHRVDIPTLMRTHMYAMQYGNADQAQATLADVPRESGLDVCRTCATCGASCAHTVNIPRKIHELKAVQFA
jgi:predicted aldo/keto reductase-like oxidoreductase